MTDLIREIFREMPIVDVPGRPEASDGFSALPPAALSEQSAED